ncbi:MAG: L-fucose mutarotase [Clostridia bacterium]
MLKNVCKLISPQLLKVLCEMGHGDEIVIADANFPAHSISDNVVRLDGVAIPQLLEGILQLFPLDSYAEENAIFMQVVTGDTFVPVIWKKYDEILAKAEFGNAKKAYLERFAYYERAKKCYAVVLTGEESQYANLILKKGVIK